MKYENAYKRHFRKPLREIADTLGEWLEQDGCTVEVWEDVADDCFGWMVDVALGTAHAGIEIKLSDAVAFEGEEEAGKANVALQATGEGGEIIGAIIPFNYTPQVWVRLGPDGRDVLFERLQDIRHALPYVASMVKTWLAEKETVDV